MVALSCHTSVLNSGSEQEMDLDIKVAQSKGTEIDYCPLTRSHTVTLAFTGRSIPRTQPCRQNLG